MGSLNRAEILGTMGADPEVKQLQGGNKVAQFTLATNDPAHKLVLLNNGRNSQQSAQQPTSGATAQPAPQSTTQAAQSGSYGAKDDDLPF